MSCKITAAAAAFRHVFSPYISQQESFLGSVQYRLDFCFVSYLGVLTEKYWLRPWKAFFDAVDSE